MMLFLDLQRLLCIVLLTFASCFLIFTLVNSKVAKKAFTQREHTPVKDNFNTNLKN